MAILSMQEITKSLLPARSDLHIIRKVWHMAVGSLFLYMYCLGNAPAKTWGWFALTIAVLGFAADFLRLRSEKMNQMAVRFFGPFLRESERKDYSGLPFYALGCGLSLFLYNEQIAILSILFLVFSDPISSYFGVKYGKTKLLPNKSLQGSTAGFCTCYLITLIFGIVNAQVSVNLLGFALMAGLVGAISELMSVFVDDNLTIPVISGFGLTFLNMFFQIF